MQAGPFFKSAIASLIGAQFLVSCMSNHDFTQAASVDAAFKANLAALHGKTVFFGHQSVGKEIMQGLEDLLSQAGEKGFRVSEGGSVPAPSGPGIIHAKVGANRDPVSKCDAWAESLRRASARFDVAVLKFCYVDIQETTGVAAILDHYKRTVDSLRLAYPGMAFVHSTVPLKGGRGGIKEKIKRMLGKELSTDESNVRRREYNDLLRKAFAGEPIFDIAAAESRYPDGSVETFERAGETYPALIPALSYDGGHLNEVGRRIAAKELVAALANSLSARTAVRAP